MDQLSTGAPGAAAEISLAFYEKALARLDLLKSLASSLFVVMLFALVPLELLGSARPLAFLVMAGCAAFSFLWLWALGRMWRTIIAVSSLLMALALIALPYLIVASDFSISSIAAAFDQTSGLWILPCGFTFFILVDGVLLSIAPDRERQLLVTADPGGAAIPQVLRAAVGIHPICGWLPNGWRRAVAHILFVFSAIVRGLTLCLLILIWLMSTLQTVLSGASWTYTAGLSSFLTLATVTLFGLVGAAITAVVRYGAGRFARISAEHLMGFDSRPPILFLRSFQDDQVRLSWKRKGQFRAWMAYGEPAPTLDHVVLDEATPLGPIVAIGVPGAPVPFGVARTYLDDSEWQDAVQGLAKAARAIVIALDETTGVKWELAHIDSSEYSAKTLYLLPPRLTAPSASSVFLHREALRASKGEKNAGQGQLASPCIGWFRTSDGKMMILTSKQPVAASYIGALRLFRAHQTNGYLPVASTLQFAPASTAATAPDLARLIERDADTFFQTKRGIVVLLRDARAVAPVDGEYVFFDTMLDYRKSANDQELWLVVGDAAEKKNFLLSLRAAGP
jgi:hypothetical protein